MLEVTDAGNQKLQKKNKIYKFCETNMKLLLEQISKINSTSLKYNQN